MEEEIALEEIYKAFRWDERLKELERTKQKISGEWQFRIVRGCLIAFSSYLILVLITSLLNDILYYVSDGTRQIGGFEIGLIAPCILLGLAFMLFPAK
ncbi:MAG: hypothetical protein QMD21_01085 [Candidatus Thermoplasmatota archaeon]|nr:hypothetical protein [Candidatus Thermoplasmatota archaeon]MDI6855366.1 hypothetical protein [Candidatus Thermoplasmatota archaeon]